MTSNLDKSFNQRVPGYLVNVCQAKVQKAEQNTLVLAIDRQNNIPTQQEVQTIMISIHEGGLKLN